MKKKTLVSVIAVVMAFLLVMSLMLSAMGSMGALASDSGSCLLYTSSCAGRSASYSRTSASLTK